MIKAKVFEEEYHGEQVDEDVQRLQERRSATWNILPVFPCGFDGSSSSSSLARFSRTAKGISWMRFFASEKVPLFSFTRTIRLAVRVKVTVVRTLKQSYARRGVDVGAGADVVAGAGDCGVDVDSDVAVDSDSVADDCGVGADADDAVVAAGIVVAVAASSGCEPKTGRTITFTMSSEFLHGYSRHVGV